MLSALVFGIIGYALGGPLGAAVGLLILLFFDNF